MLVNPLQPRLPLEVGSNVSWSSLSISSLSLALSRLPSSVFTLVITPNMLTAQRLYDELGLFADQIDYAIFPDWETLPYDHFSPHQDIISARLLNLYRLPLLRHGILIAPINTLLQRIEPLEYVENQSLVVANNENINIQALRERFIARGYRHVEQVFEHGEFAIRGSIVDVFPMGTNTAYRLDLFDEVIDSIRAFDVQTQRSIAKVECIHLLPAREFPLDEPAISLFRQQWRNKFSGDPTNCVIYQDISQGLSVAGVEYYLPLFFQHTANLLDYLPKQSQIVLLEGWQVAAEKYWHDINHRYEQLRHDVTRPLLAPTELFYSVDDLRLQYQRYPLIHVEFTVPQARFRVDAAIRTPIQQLADWIALHPQYRILFSAESLGRREALVELLKTIQIYPQVIDNFTDFLQSNVPYAITLAQLEIGFELSTENICLITESELYGKQVMQRRSRKTSQQSDAGAIIKNLTELALGSPVVHIDHGVGRYLGLQTLDAGGIQAEYLTLEYADNNKLYVPVSQLYLISRYGGIEAENAPLNSLGSPQWQKAKEKAANRIHDVAAELLAIQAQRVNTLNHHYQVDETAYQQFASAFAFELTPDQEQAIDAVLADMQGNKVMDRLICGDVGFGKTEVAMRAAFVAAHNSRQVAILVPTTLLAQQHYDNFKNRFSNTAICIDMLSRFRSAKEQKQILQQLADGKLDIVIGTHKLLQTDMKFANLGLLVIDEEHRFGVRQKEKIKALKAEIDILTLTATPIPRTLNLALSDVRDLSIIGTPPAKRLAIKTFVHEFNPALIKEAILREIMRGGQVYYLHNNTDTIAQRARELREWLPEATIRFAHGQMPEVELEQIMNDFYHQRFNVLICTTIIENGIDIPTANTIIMERADKLGLSQMHQLRGRVGRSHHQAYAYLLTPHASAVTSDARKRLEAITSLEDLGAGFTLATHDLEIRGAGEFLGEEQSGHMQAIGFSLYMEFLERAVKSLQTGEKIDLTQAINPGAEIDLHLSALLPEDYIADVHTRLILYKRLATAKNNEELRELQVELIDRFGLLPENAKNLFMLTEFKLQAETLGIKKMDITAQRGKIVFTDKPNIDPLKLIELIQKQANIYQLQGPTTLIIKKITDKLTTIKDLLHYLHQ